MSCHFITYFAHSRNEFHKQCVHTTCKWLRAKIVFYHLIFVSWLYSIETRLVIECTVCWNVTSRATAMAPFVIKSLQIRIQPQPLFFQSYLSRQHDGAFVWTGYADLFRLLLDLFLLWFSDRLPEYMQRSTLSLKPCSSLIRTTRGRFNLRRQILCGILWNKESLLPNHVTDTHHV